MKKIVITGALGYIGTELCKIYSGHTHQFEIIALDNKFYSDRVNRLHSWGIKFIQCDILDKNKLKEVLKEADFVFHLAGITDVPQTAHEKDPAIDKLIKNVGVDGSKNIINFSEDYTKIIFPSTHVIYEGVSSIEKNITEEKTPKPVLDYAKGKYQTELDLKNSKKNYVILRLGSVYGLSSDSTRLNVMPNLFSKIASQDGTIKLFSGGKQLKSLVSVQDVARCMKFVADDEDISQTTFNCVNENLNVKKVAQICKKYNKSLKLIDSKDPVPNLGYTLSNKKILKTGFVFLHNIENSISEMIDYWKLEKKEFENESLSSGKDNYIDSRGLISNYYLEEPINSIGYVESSKNSVRGNHFHPIQTQKCLLIKGRYISVSKNLLDKSSVVETRIVKEGELSIIPPNVAHTMIFLEDSILLNLVSGERQHQNYGVTHTMPYTLVDSEMAEFLIQNYKYKCRVCFGDNLKLIISLGNSPLANNLLNEKNEKFNVFPLEMFVCTDCFNCQLSVVIPPKIMFDEYLYLSSTTETFREHFKNLAKKLSKENTIGTKSFVVDIGSNDGIFLEPLSELGIKCLGVEPAKNIAKIANKNNLKTLNGYFNQKIVERIIKDEGKADVVTAFNVFAHNDDLHDIASNVEKLLKKDGVFIFEVQYLVDNMKLGIVDNIYHEHVNYWSLYSLEEFFKHHNLKLFKIENVDTHGGSIRVYCSKNKNKNLHKSVNLLRIQEKSYGINRIETYLNFRDDVFRKKNKLINLIKELKRTELPIIGYGAPAKATTLLNYLNLSDKDFKFIVEDNELKIGKYIPGTKIKIISSKDIKKSNSYNFLVLAWNFYDLIVKKNKTLFERSKFFKFN